jgi:hypothetical protein
MKKTFLAIGLLACSMISSCGIGYPIIAGKYSVIVTTYGSGTIEFSDPGEVTYDTNGTWHSYEPGTQITLTATPASYYYFHDWESLPSGDFISKSKTITITVDHTPIIIMASFFHGTATQPAD